MTRGVSAESLSCIVPPGMRGPTSPALPGGAGASLPHVRRYSTTRRRPPSPLGGLPLSLVPRSLACCSPCVVSPQGAWAGRSAQLTPGRVVTRSPPPGMPQGERWLSHVPECPLWTQAPLSAPSGGLRPRPTAPRTAACRSVETVGLPRRTTGRDILLSTTLPVSGLYHAACVLAPPGSIRPLAGRHAGAFLTGWRGVDQGGLEPCDSHPLGNRNQFHGFAPNPKVSSLPWRDHCFVQVSR